MSTEYDGTTAPSPHAGAVEPAADPGWPLVDPDRDVRLLPDGTGHGRDAAAVRAVRAGFEEVRARVVAEGVWKAEPAPGRVREPLHALPALAALHPLAEPVLRYRVETLVSCLQTLVRRYPYDAELRDFLGVPAAMDAVVHAYREAAASAGKAEGAAAHRETTAAGRENTTADGENAAADGEDAAGPAVDLCRLDLLGSTLGTVRVLEFNPSCPGGLLSAGMLGRFWRESAAAPALEHWQVPPAPIEYPAWFADWLLAHGRRHGLEPPHLRKVGLFRPPEGTSFEFGLMAAQLRARGSEPVEADPADAAAVTALRLGYLKHLPVEGGPADTWHTFHAQLRRFAGRPPVPALVVPNLPAERWVAENKLCLAVLSDPRFRRLFPAAWRWSLDALVPWSRKLGDGITPAEAVAERARLVLKAPYSCRGRAVVIGADTPADEWERTVRSLGHRGWLVQEQVSAERLTSDEEPCHRDLVVPVLEGRVIGYGSRMSQGHLLNTARGGGTPVLYPPHPLPFPPHDEGRESA